MEKIKAVFKIILYLALSTLISYIPFGTVLSIPLVILSTSEMVKIIYKVYPDSCFFTYNKKGKENNIKIISQNILDFKTLFRALKFKNKEEFFGIQALNIFLQLDSHDKNMNQIKYEFTSQAYTTFLVKKLEKLEYITDFKKEKVEGKFKYKLWLERLMLGVKLAEKAPTLYKMSFRLTGKKADLNQIAQAIGLDINKYDIVNNKNSYSLQFKKNLNSTRYTINKTDNIPVEENLKTFSDMKTKKDEKYYDITKNFEEQKTELIKMRDLLNNNSTDYDIEENNKKL